jgi:hypothetical protein
MADTEFVDYSMQLRNAIVALALAAWGASAAAQWPALTSQAIVELPAAGFKEDFLIDLIEKSKTQFDTTVSA